MMTYNEYESIVLMNRGLTTDSTDGDYAPDEVLRTDDIIVAEFYSKESRGRGRYL